MNALIWLSLLSLLSACRDKGPDLVDIQQVNVSYTDSQDDFPNPERGFYRYSETYASDYSPLSADELKGYRDLQSIESANYRVYSTLVFRYYIFDNLKSAPVSGTVLNGIQTDMDAARAAGVKLIPRFVYTVRSNAGDCPEGFICPPYGDATKQQVLAHIAQLKPVLQKNADVIACVQLGFIGTWGEQYYSDFFGDASQNGGQENKLSDQNWRDRAEVIKALLDAVPADRMIQVRYPQIKQRFLYGVNASLTSAALTEQSAYTVMDNARIGFHNDCFLASSNDYGTYEDYGNDASPRTGDAQVVSTLRDFMKDDSRFVVVGGETCSDDYSPQNDCEPAGVAQTEMATMHYSFLNAHYNNAVNNDWQSGGCMDNIKRNLGYRFVLQSASLPDNTVKGTVMKVVLNIRNAGYAAPYNARPAKLVLRNTSSGKETIISLGSDVRRWFSGNNTITEEIAIPSDMEAGNYALYIWLPDAHASIAARPEYAIRFANQEVWEAKTGYNSLQHTVSVH
ncbi:MAG: DUF4832 domain-containing protein [Mucilaginibacter polytrichastri]|nr:DUF4832 domain-containing protein [Mucilaginibacter polytrichastri]